MYFINSLLDNIKDKLVWKQMCAEEKDPVLQFGITCILDGVTYHEKASVGCFVGKGFGFFLSCTASFWLRMDVFWGSVIWR